MFPRKKTPYMIVLPSVVLHSMSSLVNLIVLIVRKGVEHLLLMDIPISIASLPCSEGPSVRAHNLLLVVSHTTRRHHIDPFWRILKSRLLVLQNIPPFDDGGNMSLKQ